MFPKTRAEEGLIKCDQRIVRAKADPDLSEQDRTEVLYGLEQERLDWLCVVAEEYNQTSHRRAENYLDGFL